MLTIIEDAALEPLWDIFNNFWAQDSNLSEDENENDNLYPPVVPLAIEDGSIDDPDDDEDEPESEGVPTTQPEQTQDDEYDPYADRVVGPSDFGEVDEIEATQPSPVPSPMEPDSQPFTPPGPPSGFPLSPSTPPPLFVAGGGERAPSPKVGIPGTGIGNGSMPPPPPLTTAQLKEKSERMEAIKCPDSN